MRPLIVALSGALWLTACTEAKSPQPPAVQPPTSEPKPVDPTDVLDGGAEATQPPPAPEEEAVPVLPPAFAPVEGHATVQLPTGEPGMQGLDEVRIQLDILNLAAAGKVEVEFVAPDGLPYEKRARAVEAAAGEPVSVSFTLPVAGTAIASSGMTGVWGVRFFLDGAPLTTTSFTLEP
ncbi:hypothetical protein DRW03_26980 [Corallococcus sp. H22C18031201]|uniref:hypothetical protein n=1 Tax=Citreicoccus inhibens TaxID=2849499 RepID=UPI000E74846D|nr:hypothetical protein [Citreicoccus inhibens]MBU8894790.1 hypothetical protein [Citreicoccus inhibens]RJS17639.1 hypothetical protein DRW03_26980 [Corallococcus sp. H22C18031201]